MALTLVLADDHPIVLDGLEHLFRLEPDIKVLARCTTGEETLHAVRHHRPDVLILDLRMPAKDGLAVLREMEREKISTWVVLLAGALDDNDLLEAIRLGVRGVVLKEMASQLLVRCVRTVHAGGRWMESGLLTRALEELSGEADARRGGSVLTPREVEVAQLVAKGRANKEIAEHLGISEGTVKIHLHNIYEKVNVKSRLELSLYARDKGLI